MSSIKLWVWPFVALIELKKGRSLARRVQRKLTGKNYDEHEASLPRSIPKTIWIFWDKGEAAAPPLVKSCIDSWRQQNPSWKVQVLDETSAGSAVDMPPRPASMPIQAYCDLLRLRLLRRHGGVWADATVFCFTPLDNWLPAAAQRGFFMFVWTDADAWFILPNVLRRVTNWFLASEPEGEIVSIWETASFDYWEGREAAHIYYWPHALFEFLILANRRMRKAWRAMPKFGAFSAHVVADHVRCPRDIETVRAALATGALPLQKLRWNWTPEQMARACEVMDALPRPETAPPAKDAARV